MSFTAGHGFFFALDILGSMMYCLFPQHISVDRGPSRSDWGIVFLTTWIAAGEIGSRIPFGSSFVGIVAQQDWF